MKRYTGIRENLWVYGRSGFSCVRFGYEKRMRCVAASSLYIMLIDEIYKLKNYYLNACWFSEQLANIFLCIFF